MRKIGREGRRKDDRGEYLVVLNHSDNEHPFTLNVEGYQLDIHNLENRNPDTLMPWEARLYRRVQT